MRGAASVAVLFRASGTLPRMKQLVARIVKLVKRFFVRLIVLARKQGRKIEAKLDKLQPHPVLGVLIIILGVFFILAGFVMLFTPGQGILTLALGIACVNIGVKAMKGKYGPERKEREKARKHARLERRREKRAKKRERRAREHERKARRSGRGELPEAEGACKREGPSRAVGS